MGSFHQHPKAWLGFHGPQSLVDVQHYFIRCSILLKKFFFTMFIHVLCSCKIICLPLKMYLICKNRSKQKFGIQIYISKSHTAMYFQILSTIVIITVETQPDSFISLGLLSMFTVLLESKIVVRLENVLFVSSFCFIRKSVTTLQDNISNS